MTDILGSTRTLLRIGFLAAAVIAATIMVGGEAKPASASHTEIIISLSNTEPAPAPVIVLQPGQPIAFYVWAVGVDDPTGVSGFQVEVTFSDALLNVFFAVTEADWLGSTGRSVSCFPPEINADHVTLSCNTIGAASPPGPTGDGLLATIGLLPVPDPGPSSVLNLSGQPAPSNGTYLLSTPQDLSIQQIPLALRNTLVFLKCGNVVLPTPEDTIVDLFNDIVGVINHFGMFANNEATWPEGYVWDSAFDMDENGSIDLFNDILGVIQQYGTNCTQV